MEGGYVVFVLGWFDFFDFFCMSITYSVRWKNRIVGFIRIVLSSDVLIFFILYDLIYSDWINLCWGWPFREQRHQYYNGFLSPQLPCGSWRSEFRMLILISNISIRRPLAEADVNHGLILPMLIIFQSTAPSRKLTANMSNFLFYTRHILYKSYNSLNHFTTHDI